MNYIKVRGAREHNLKNININIPKNKLVVFTGVSGSGKSSLAMDTIYAEGQRRYVESLSSYARQFLGVLEKPEVESIEGLSPAIAIDQKSTSHNPRSTVGTVTEIYDFLRLLFARVGHPHCHKCASEVSKQSTHQIVNQITEIGNQKAGNKKRGVRIMILSPVARDRKGEFKNLFENLIKQGIIQARIDGKFRNLNEEFNLIKTNKHSIDAVIDRIVIHKKAKIKEQKELKSRIFQSVELALSISSGNIIVSEIKDNTFEFPKLPIKYEDHLFSERFACPSCNISLPEIEPRTFSFNSPHGACTKCHGIGYLKKVDRNLIYNPKLTIEQGGMFPWTNLFEGFSWNRKIVEAVSNDHNIPLNIPISGLDNEKINILLYGTGSQFYPVSYVNREGRSRIYDVRFEGLIPRLERRYKETDSDYIRREIEKYMVNEPCPECFGTRLKEQSLSITIDNKSIYDVSEMSLNKLYDWVKKLFMETKHFGDRKILSEIESKIAAPIIKEINSRLKFLNDVGIGYLTTNRASYTLAGGEAQRIRLASQIGSGLSGVLYVLDEPSIGLHARDQGRLISTLKDLRDLDNTVIVVEHDPQTIESCDYIFDFGPGAGKHGGRIVAEGTPSEIKSNIRSLTGKYLSGKKKVIGQIPEVGMGMTEDRNKNSKLTLLGCKEHNLKNIDVTFPLGKFICVTGVSGSGKSTLIDETLSRQLRQEFGLKNENKPGNNSGVGGIENIDKVVIIDQSPIGRTPRSNPATYTKTFDYIRSLFAQTKDAKLRGYKPGRFSFNVKGGRCENCKGEGQIKIEMQFMPDVYIDCEVCNGSRYNSEVLEIEYKNKNIAQVLSLTVEEALNFFNNIPQIKRKLKTMYDVGLGYIELGQPAPTLSGGEAQRVKLSSELSKKFTGKTFYILDEPTTGLHFADLQNLINIIKTLVSKGNTVCVIEHNLDVIKNADWVIDLGPEGGDEGGNIVFEGPLSVLTKQPKSHTGKALKSLLKDKMLS